MGARDRAEEAIARCLYANGLSFNLVRSPYWKEMVAAIKESPAGYTSPGYEKVHTYSSIHSVKRNRLGSKKAEDLVFIHSNLRLLSRKNDHYKEGATKLWDVAPECANLDATLHDLVTVGDGDDVSVARAASSISGTMLSSNDLSAVGDDNENVDFLANPYDSKSNSD